MSHKIEKFKNGVDFCTSQVLLSKSCYLIWRNTEDNNLSFIYDEERKSINEIPELHVIDKLSKTIRILLGFERYQHIHYLLSIFDLSKKCRAKLFNIIQNDNRIKKYPEVQLAFIENHNISFSQNEYNISVKPISLIPKDEILGKISQPNPTFDIRWDNMFSAPRIENYNQNSYLRHKLKILLLGSFSPGMKKLLNLYQSGEKYIREKLENEIALNKTEILLYTRDILENRGHSVFIANSARRNQRSVWHRLIDLLSYCDLIFVFMTNTGGIVNEATMIAERKLGYKTIYFIHENEKISGLMKQGLFLLPQIKTLYYKSQDELLDLVIRSTEAFQAEHYLNFHSKDEIVFRGFYNIRRKKIRTNKTTISYDIMEIRDVVSILAITENNKVVLCRQYRYPVMEYIFDLPAGYVELGENLIDAAKRELEEETGYIAQNVHQLGTFYPLAGITNMKIHYFLAKELRKSAQKLDPNESIETKLMDINVLIENILNRSHRDLPSSNVIFMYKIMKDLDYKQNS